MLVAASVISPILTHIGGAPDNSAFGLVRNGLTAAALFVASAYLVRASLHKFTGSTEGRWFLRFVALACAIGGCAVLACLSGAYPGLYPTVCFALSGLAMALLAWPLSFASWLGNADDSSGGTGNRAPLGIVLAFFFCAICATLVFVAKTAEALRILGILPRVTWSVPPLPISENGLLVALAVFGCLLTYFMVHTTRLLLLAALRERSLSQCLFALLLGGPATLMLIWGSLGFFLFADSPFRSLAAIPFVAMHVFLIGCAAADKAPPGLSHWLRWRAQSDDKRIRRALEAKDVKERFVKEGKMKWLLHNYNTLRLPQYGDVYEATCDVPLRAVGSDGRTPCEIDRCFVLPNATHVRVVDVPCYIRAPERTDALQYLTEDILAECHSLPPAYPDAPEIDFQGYRVDLSCLMEQFKLVQASERGAQSNYVELSLEGLRELDAATALTVAGFGGRLKLDTITALSHEAARALEQHSTSSTLHSAWGPASLSLNGLTSLDEETARTLAAYEGSLSLNGVTTLTDDASQALSQHRNRLSLEGLTTLSITALAALRARQSPAIRLAKKFDCSAPLQYQWDELKQALERSSDVLGSAHRDTVLLRAWYYIAKMRSKAADEEATMKKAITISRKLLGGRHSETESLQVQYKNFQKGATTEGV